MQEDSKHSPKGESFQFIKKIFMKLVPVYPIVLMIQKKGLDRKNVYTLTRNTQKNSWNHWIFDGSIFQIPINFKEFNFGNYRKYGKFIHINSSDLYSLKAENCKKMVCKKCTLSCKIRKKLARAKSSRNFTSTSAP